MVNEYGGHDVKQAPSRSHPSGARRKKAVDEDLYKISPNLLYARTQKERSFQRGLAYVIAMVSEFDEYTNDWLYLREGSIISKPRYRKRTSPYLDPSIHAIGGKNISSVIKEAPPVLVEKIFTSRSVRATINEVKILDKP